MTLSNVVRKNPSVSKGSLARNSEGTSGRKRIGKEAGRKSRAPNDIDKAIGVYIRERRRDMNMTLAELGADLGISHQQLQKYETGVNRVSAGMLYHIAECLNTSIDDMYSNAYYSDMGADPLEREKGVCIAIINRTTGPHVIAAMKKVLSALAHSE